MNKSKCILIIILLIGILARTIAFGELPDQVHVDEVGMGYDAYCLANYSVDRHLYKFPVYLINYGGGQSALYAYLAAICVKFFDLSIVTIRLPALICSLIALVLTYFLAKKNKDNKLATIFFFLVAISPWHIMQSRWGLDCNLMSSFLIYSIFFFSLAINKSKLRYFILAGCFFGLTLYTYALAYITIPIFLFLSLLYLLYIKKINIKQIIVLGIPIFILAMPLILMILINMGYIPEIRTDYISIPKLSMFRKGEISIKNVFLNFKPYIESILGKDNLYYNTISAFGTMYNISIPFIILGIVISIKNSRKNKEFNLDIIMLFAVISMTICILITAYPNINKANAIFIPLLYFAAIGIKYIIEKKDIIRYVIIGIYLIQFFLFSYIYFTTYSKIYGEIRFFENKLIEAVSIADKFENKNVNILSFYYPRMYIAFATRMSPYDKQDKYIINFNKEILDYNSVYIIPKRYYIMEELLNNGFECIESGAYLVLYKGER